MKGKGLLMKYFVLKPSGTDAYAKASRTALYMYAASISEEDPELCGALREWADQESNAASLQEAKEDL